jgi:hypothetical protein
MDIWLKLQYRLGREGMRDYLALACVLRPISCVEETALNADESIIKVTAASMSVERCISPRDLSREEPTILGSHCHDHRLAG